MNRLKNLIPEEYSNPYLIFCCLLILAFPLSAKAFAVIVVIMGLFWIWKKDYKNIYPNIKKNWLTLFVIGLFLIEAVGLLYTDNLHEGTKQLEKLYFPLVMLVVFTSSLTLTDKQRKATLALFTLSMALLLLICYVHAVYATGTFYPQHDPDHFLYAHGFSRTSYTEIIGGHPGYLSMGVLVAIVFLLDYLLNTDRKTTTTIVGSIVLILFNTVNLVILSSKIHLALLILILLFFFLKRIPQVQGRKFKIITLVTGSIGILAMIYFIKSDGQIQYRFVSEMPSSLVQKQQQWQTAFDVWAQNPIAGVGMGDKQAELNRAHTRRGFTENINRNSHNQYLDFLVSLGIIGLTWFLALMVISFWQSIKLKDPVFFLFNVIFFASCVTESVLHRFFGFSFFLLFIIIFTNRNADQEY